jgi:Glycosyl transferase family 2
VKVVLSLIVRPDQDDLVDAQIAYHLNAGVDLVLATTDTASDSVRDLVDAYERAGVLHVIQAQGANDAESWTRMARLAANEHDADWVINSGTGEFWWPRGESLKDVLAPIPPRYTVVQALLRTFAAGPEQDALFSERMTRRSSLRDDHDVPRSPASVLRPVHRASPAVAVHADRSLTLPRLVPLRAWYPIEVFDQFGEAGGEAGSLVPDTRLRDALRVLREQATDGTPGRFALPAGEERILAFRTPDVVDDAAYAVECAAVGEVDLPRLEEYISQLEQRIGWLEQRFWPRVLRLGSRVMHRVAGGRGGGSLASRR